MAVAVSTRGYDNARTGANTQEEVLTAQAVGTRGVRRLYSLTLPGDARGVEAQPLVVPGVSLPDGTTRDVVYLATMANQVWAFDSADGTLLWEHTLGEPITGSATFDHYSINDHWGILSTPVIDLKRNTMYVVAWVSKDRTPASAQHVIHALDITDGRLVHPALSLESAVYSPGHGLPDLTFESAMRKQRPSLLLTEIDGVTTVFVGFGSLSESGRTSRGWVLAVGTQPFEVTAAWATTAKGSGGGIWQAGGGLVADSEGAIYAMTGNGAFDGVTDFSESFIKLKYTPPAQNAAASLSIVDWWTPYTDAQRTAGAALAAPAANRPTATNFRAYVAKANAMDGWDDMDLGSGGPVLVESAKLVLGAGKDGVLYVLHSDAMGKTMPADLSNPKQNYQKLASPPIFYTYYPPGLDSAPADIRTLNVLWGDKTHHQHGSSLFWNSTEHGPMLFCWGENGNLRAWALEGANVRYLAAGAEVASAEVTKPGGGMPGGMLALGANAKQANSGVVWATIPYFDANQVVGPGRLLAYDATTFDTNPDGSKRLRVLWDSQDWALTFMYNKFTPPVVAGGKVYVPTYEGRVDVYG